MILLALSACERAEDAFDTGLPVPEQLVPSSAELVSSSSTTPETSEGAFDGTCPVPIGTDGDDILIGTRGGDTLQGGDGNDILIADPSSDVLSVEQASRFLTQSTFGPKVSEVACLIESSPSAWMVDQFQKPVSLASDNLPAFPFVSDIPDEVFAVRQLLPTFSFWKFAVEGEDQLRQRMAYALSQIFVVSDSGGTLLFQIPEGITRHQDILSRNAFGNYRDLLEEITYEPAMGFYLTYIGNQKADAVTGRVPDENYARELLQLFTVGLVELNLDGTPVLDENQEPIELFDNMDITGLARVFTGLDLKGLDRNADTMEDILSDETGLYLNFLEPMVVVEEVHSQEEKAFLNCTIPAGTAAAESIDLALDCIMDHPNIGPFISRQLIQRFTTSDPSPAYVARVATVFNEGQYTLPIGVSVGDGRKGDLKATIAAILLDEEVRSDDALTNPAFGKVREPVLRLTHWARAFDAPGGFPEYVGALYQTQSVGALNQHPYRSPSVFNFYRPGYIAPGTLTGAAGMTAPELQLVNASSTTGYINFMTQWIFDSRGDILRDPDAQADIDRLKMDFVLGGGTIDDAAFAAAYIPDYTDEIALAGDATALIDHLDQHLVYGTMSAETRDNIIGIIDDIPLEDASDSNGLTTRVHVAVLLVMTAPDYLVQR